MSDGGGVSADVDCPVWVDEMNRRWARVALASKDVVVDLHDLGRERSHRGFMELLAHEKMPAPGGGGDGDGPPRMVSKAKAWLEHPKARRFNGVTFAPGEAPIVRGLLNLWREPASVRTLRQAGGDAASEHVRLWRSVLLDLCNGVAEDAAHIEQWVAFKLRNPGRKINHGILLSSVAQGSGKSLWFSGTLRLGLGDEYVGDVEGSKLASRFNSWAFRRVALVFEEVMHGDRLDVMESLKPWLAAPPRNIQIERKGQDIIEVPNIVGAVILSNHLNALPLAAEDRRLFVIRSDAPPLDGERMTALARALDPLIGGADVLAYLDQMDLSAFDPYAPPPMTDAKRDAIEDSAPMWAQDLAGLWEGGQAPFHRPSGLVLVREVFEAVRHTHPRLKPKSVSAWMDRQAGLVRLVNPGRPNYRKRFWLSGLYSVQNEALGKEIAYRRETSGLPDDADAVFQAAAEDIETLHSFVEDRRTPPTYMESVEHMSTAKRKRH